MSIPITITKREYNKIAHQLRTDEVIVCINKQAHIIVLAIASEMLQTGWTVKAKIRKGYEDEP